MTLSAQTRPTRGLYNLKVHAQFCSAHALRDYPGDCRRLHGHSWQVDTHKARVRCSELAA